MLFLGKIIFGDEIFIQHNYYLPVKIRRIETKSLSATLKSNKLKTFVMDNKTIRCRVLPKKEKSVLFSNNIEGRVK